MSSIRAIEAGFSESGIRDFKRLRLMHTFHHHPHHPHLSANARTMLFISCVLSSAVCLRAALLLYDHIRQVYHFSPTGALLQSRSTTEKDTFLRDVCSSEFSRRRFGRRLCSVCGNASPYIVLMETKHVVWQAHSFVLPTSVSWPELSVYRHCNASSSSTRKAVLKRCLNVAANFRHCYFRGDSLIGVITSVFATRVRCKSNGSMSQ